MGTQEAWAPPFSSFALPCERVSILGTCLLSGSTTVSLGREQGSYREERRERRRRGGMEEEGVKGKEGKERRKRGGGKEERYMIV